MFEPEKPSIPKVYGFVDKHYGNQIYDAGGPGRVPVYTLEAAPVQQAPVGEVTDAFDPDTCNPNASYIGATLNTAGQRLPAGTKLFAAAGAQPVQQESCRIELVTAIHTLASHYENKLCLFQDDEEAHRVAKGDIAHARKVAAKWNWNGTAPMQAPAYASKTSEPYAQESDDLTIAYMSGYHDGKKASQKQRKPLTDEQVKMLNFLFGAGEWYGVWFGEHHLTEKGVFWWRKHLRRVFDVGIKEQP